MDELEALKVIDTALGSLDAAAQSRSLDWLIKKYGGPTAPLHRPDKPPHSQASGASARVGELNLSVASIAQKLKARSVDEVLRAAAASMTIVQGHDHFPWRELLAEAARATGYWTKHHPSNATKALKRLKANDTLVELANGELALSPTAKDAVAIQLGAV